MKPRAKSLALLALLLFALSACPGGCQHVRLRREMRLTTAAPALLPHTNPRIPAEAVTRGW